MGKVAKIKSELEDVSSLLEIITVMKDVSTNRFFVFSAKKKSYEKYFKLLLSFFDMVKNISSSYPLIRNNYSGVDILVITSEQSFMAQLNGKVSVAAQEVYQRYPDARLICVGPKGADKCKSMGMRVEKVFPLEGVDHGQAAGEIRDFFIQRMLDRETGKVIVVYAYAKSFSVLKPRVVTLLPTEDLLAEYRADNEVSAPSRGEDEKAPVTDFIQETNVDTIVKSLAEIWVHSQLIDISSEMDVVESAAQAQQLESAIEGLSSEQRLLKIGFRKAGREKLNQSMREVFTQTSMMKAKAAKVTR